MLNGYILINEWIIHNRENRRIYTSVELLHICKDFLLLRFLTVVFILGETAGCGGGAAILFPLVSRGVMLSTLFYLAMLSQSSQHGDFAKWSVHCCTPRFKLLSCTQRVECNLCFNMIYMHILLRQYIIVPIWVMHVDTVKKTFGSHKVLFVCLNQACVTLVNILMCTGSQQYHCCYQRQNFLHIFSFNKFSCECSRRFLF